MATDQPVQEGLTLTESKAILDMLDAMESEISQRDRGMTMTHEVGRVSVSFRTERARLIVNALRRVL